MVLVFRIPWRIRIASIAVLIPDLAVGPMNNHLRMLATSDRCCPFDGGALCSMRRCNTPVALPPNGPARRARHYALVLAHILFSCGSFRSTIQLRVAQRQ